MNELLSKLILIIFFTYSFTSAISQVKYEKESRMKRAKVPHPALELIESLENQVKAKWYSEMSLSNTTVEAKFRYNKKKYSIEFDTEGNLMDMEIEIHVSEMPENVKQNIFTKLESEFNKYSIQKIQKHYPAKKIEIQAFFKNNQSLSENLMKYEIVVNGKNNNTTKQYEMVFDNNGMLTSKKEIIQKNADNLEF